MNSWNFTLFVIIITIIMVESGYTPLVLSVIIENVEQRMRSFLRLTHLLSFVLFRFCYKHLLKRFTSSIYTLYGRVDLEVKIA